VVDDQLAVGPAPGAAAADLALRVEQPGMRARRLQDLGGFLGHPAGDGRLARILVGLAVARPIFVDQAAPPAEQRLDVRLAVVARVERDHLALLVEVEAQLAKLAERLHRAASGEQRQLALLLFLFSAAHARRRPRRIERVPNRTKAAATSHSARPRRAAACGTVRGRACPKSGSSPSSGAACNSRRLSA
jgi:hypothetical protein